MNNSILLVEDDESIISYIKKLLALNGYAAQCVRDAKEAIKLFKDENSKINLVITDFSLPGKSGLELIEELKLINPGFKAIIYSGYSDTAPQIKPIIEKGYKFITKPFGMSEFIMAVREALKTVSGQ